MLCEFSQTSIDILVAFQTSGRQTLFHDALQIFGIPQMRSFQLATQCTQVVHLFTQLLHHCRMSD